MKIEPRLKPEDIAEALRIKTRQACRVMRQAGGYRLGESWRLKIEDFEKWEKAQSRKGATSTGIETQSAANDGQLDAEPREQRRRITPTENCLPPIPITQPKKRRR